MKLLQLRYFQVICKYNNITRAARELHVSQPSLSSAVKELESEFGVSLFQRHSRGLEPTSAGRYLLEASTKLLDQADDLVQHMQALGKTDRTLRLGVPPQAASLVFPQLLQAARKQVPGLRLHVEELGTLRSKSMVLDGSLDAAIISRNAPLPPSFAVCNLCWVQIRLYVSTANPLAGKSCVAIRDLAGVPLALLAEDAFLTDCINRHFHDLGLTPNTVVHTNQLATIHQLVKDNTAAAFLFDGALPPNRRVARLPVPELPRVRIDLVWPANGQMSGKLQDLVRVARSLNTPRPSL